MRNGWSAAALGKTVESTFKLGDKEAHFTFKIDENSPLILIYTPVTKELQTIIGKFGNYLHGVKANLFNQKEFWFDFKQLVERGLELFEYCLTGNLNGLPLVNKKTGQLLLFVSIEKELRELLQKVCDDPSRKTDVQFPSINI